MNIATISSSCMQVPEPLRQSCDQSSANELGHLVVSGLSLRCHGFTELLCAERVEYAWLIHLSMARITGTVSTLQVERRERGMFRTV